jgi:hypothetical protein
MFSIASYRSPLLFLLSLSILCSAGFAQSGIYLTGKDFSAHKITWPQHKEANYKLRLNEVIYKPFVQVKQEDVLLRISKDSIFGYRDKDNISYRFFQKKKYTITDEDEPILIYKTESFTGPKGAATITRYYFSKDVDSPVERLTKVNLIRAFSGNIALCTLINLNFQSDKELSEYDQHNKTYKLNRIFRSGITVNQ